MTSSELRQPLNQALAWDGCLNVRDLGGHRTGDGGETAWRRVVRADSVRQLSDAGWEALVDYGVRTIVDLRQHEELAADPPRDLPAELVHVPVLDPAPNDWGEIDAVAAVAPDAVTAKRDVYLEFLTRYDGRFAEAVQAVARAAEGTVLVHCAGGKDRTGLVTALLLELADVPRDTIAADYALSEVYLAPRHEEWFAQAKDDAELARLREIAATPADAMAGVLSSLEDRYGGAREYLLAAGASNADLAAVRSRLRD